MCRHAYTHIVPVCYVPLLSITFHSSVVAVAACLPNHCWCFDSVQQISTVLHGLVVSICILTQKEKRKEEERKKRLRVSYTRITTAYITALIWQFRWHFNFSVYTKNLFLNQ